MRPTSPCRTSPAGSAASCSSRSAGRSAPSGGRGRSTPTRCGSIATRTAGSTASPSTSPALRVLPDDPDAEHPDVEVVADIDALRGHRRPRGGRAARPAVRGDPHVRRLRHPRDVGRGGRLARRRARVSRRLPGRQARAVGGRVRRGHAARRRADGRRCRTHHPAGARGHHVLARARRPSPTRARAASGTRRRIRRRRSASATACRVRCNPIRPSASAGWPGSTRSRRALRVVEGTAGEEHSAIPSEHQR